MNLVNSFALWKTINNILPVSFFAPSPPAGRCFRATPYNRPAALGANKGETKNFAPRADGRKPTAPPQSDALLFAAVGGGLVGTGGGYVLFGLQLSPSTGFFLERRRQFSPFHTASRPSVRRRFPPAFFF